MCKIMMLTGIENSTLALEFMKASAIPMSYMDRDGIGYSAVNSQNKLFMEKWHNNGQFLSTTNTIDQFTIELLRPHITALKPYFATIPELKQNYTTYGEVTRNDLKTVTMHTRMATCGKSFENVHPFIDQETSLIHNGVLSNSDRLNLNKISTCDSEVALQLYLNNKLALTEKPKLIQDGLLDQLQGYWAFGILAKDANGQYMLDVLREGAQLYWTEIPEMGVNCTVFATTENIINTAILAVGLPKREIVALTESNLSRFNAVTGELVADIPLSEGLLNVRPKYQHVYVPAKHAPKTDKRDYSDPHFYKDYDMYENHYTEFDAIDKPTSDAPFEIESFYDTNEPLVDRLYEYDTLMETMYGSCYEEIGVIQRLHLEKMEEEEYLTFDDILDIIEGYNAEKLPSTVIRLAKELKRA